MSDDYTNQEPVQPHTYTHIEDVGWVCNDCGAWAEQQEEVAHYPTCCPGESTRWQKLFEEQADRWNGEAGGEENPDGPQ